MENTKIASGIGQGIGEIAAMAFAAVTSPARTPRFRPNYVAFRTLAIQKEI